MKRIYIFLLLLVSANAQIFMRGGSSSNNSGDGQRNIIYSKPLLPILPIRTVDETMPILSGTTRYVYSDGVCASHSPCYTTISAADAAASCGDIILAHAGDTITDNVTFAHACSGTGTSWIIIKTDSGSLPTVGTRVQASNSSAMMKVQTNTINVPVFQWASGTGGYRIVGLEVTCTSIACSNTHSFDNALINIDNVAASYVNQAHHVIIDRSYIHGSTAAELRRGVTFGGANQAVLDSLINEIHQSGSDSQCIFSSSSPGPMLIRNNRLEAAGENIIFGGAQGGVTNNVPSDIVILNNYFYKPLTWKLDDPSYGGILWSIKNLLEFKNAQRVLVDGNVFENIWLSAQQGYAMVWTPRDNSALQGWPTTQVSDITFKNNVAIHLGGGISLTGTDGNDLPSTITNVSLTSNVLSLTAGGGLGFPWGSTGQKFTITGMATNTFLNNQTLTVTSNNGSILTAAFTHANVVSGADTGTAILTDAPYAMRAQRIRIYNNIFIDVNNRSSIPGSSGAGGQTFQISGGGAYLTIDHNTFLNHTLQFGDANPTAVPANKPFGPATITNNYGEHGSFGWAMTSTGIGTASLGVGFAPYNFNHNVLVGMFAATGGGANIYPVTSQGGFTNGNTFCDFAGTTNSCYPTTTGDMLNYSSCNITSQIIPDLAGGCALSPSSPFHNAGTDGKDLGADMTILSAVLTAVRH
jgi:predicted outer membrane repeat protein